MVKNEEGLVAIEHYNSNGANVHMDATGHDYTWTPQYNVSLAWVKEEDVPAILAVRTRVCCGHTGNKFRLAGEMNVRIWQTGRM